MHSPNLALLRVAAIRLRPILEELVFVGGMVTSLLITDPAAAPARTTYDVDVIAAIATYAEYVAFSEKLRGLGFTEDTREGAPLCRWRHSELTLDVMPLEPGVLGFSNRWYPEALVHAHPIEIGDGLVIRAITAPYFLATKFEAFRGRGKRDYFSSADLEDFVAVLDGRPSLLDEVRQQSPQLTSYLGEATRELLAQTRFLDALPGYMLPDVASQARIGLVIERLRFLASIA
jgi:predicted nucleotidyltransferase